MFWRSPRTNKQTKTDSLTSYSLIGRFAIKKICIVLGDKYINQTIMRADYIVCMQLQILLTLPLSKGFPKPSDFLKVIVAMPSPAKSWVAKCRRRIKREKDSHWNEKIGKGFINYVMTYKSTLQNVQIHIFEDRDQRIGIYTASGCVTTKL